MKKLVALILAILMAVGMLGMAAADESDWEYIQNKGEIVVGTICA